jgi:hypothetical protein
MPLRWMGFLGCANRWWLPQLPQLRDQRTGYKL